MSKVVYKSSTGVTVGDGIRITRVSDGGQKLEVMVDEKTERYSEIVLKSDDPAPVDPDPIPEPDPTPDPDPVEPTPVDGGELLAAIQSASGGEVLESSGVVNDLTLYGLAFADPVTIKGATIKALVVNSCAGLIFEDCLFDYDYAGQPEHYQAFSINDSKRITVRNCRVIGDNGPTGHGHGWGLTATYCSDIVFEGNEVRTFLRGIKALVSDNIVVRGNDVSDMSGDAMNFAQVDGVLIEDNFIHDFRSDPASPFHKDMIQFWTKGCTAPNKNIIIRGNRLDIGDGAWTQSIFMRNEAVDTDGAGEDMYYRNVVIENNDIKNAHLWGITCSYAVDVSIVGNTLERKLNLDNPSNAGWGSNWLESVPAIMATGPLFGEVVVSGNTAPRIEIGNPDWDKGGNTVTGTGA